MKNVKYMSVEELVKEVKSGIIESLCCVDEELNELAKRAKQNQWQPMEKFHLENPKKGDKFHFGYFSEHSGDFVIHYDMEFKDDNVLDNDNHHSHSNVNDYQFYLKPVCISLLSMQEGFKIKQNDG